MPRSPITNRVYSNVCLTPTEIFSGRLYSYYNSQNVTNTAGRASAVTDLSGNSRNLAPVSTAPLISQTNNFPVQYLTMASTMSLTGAFANNAGHTKIEIFSLPARVIGSQQIMCLSEYHKTSPLIRRMSYVFTNGTLPDHNIMELYDGGANQRFDVIRGLNLFCIITYMAGVGESKLLDNSILNFGNKNYGTRSDTVLAADTLIIGNTSIGNATGDLWNFFEHINVNGALTDADIIRLRKYVNLQYQVSF
jgi:hypothetical protein